MPAIFRRVLGAWVLLPLLLLCAGARSQAFDAASPEHSDLRARLEHAAARTDHPVFDRPIYLQSTSQSEPRQQAEILARVDHPYAQVRQALAQADAWCGILILHLNVKYCRAFGSGGAVVLNVAMGPKLAQPLDTAYWARFAFSVLRNDAGHLAIAMEAPSGPFGTEDLRIDIEAAPLDAQHTALSLRYACTYGLAARWALQAYLATAGRSKVGFSQTAAGTGAAPQFIGGARGVLERNTMRYYLAIESHLGAQAQPPGKQMAAGLQDWFSATERYPLQLHEVDREAYLTTKRNEVRRQAEQTVPGHDH